MPTGARTNDGLNRDVDTVFESRAFLDSFTEGLVIHDLDGRVTDANAAATKLLGITRDQLLARTPLDPLWNAVREDGSDFPGDEQPAAVVLRTRRPCTDVVMGVGVPGAARRWLQISAHPLLVEEQLVGVSTIFADVTRSIELQKSLHESDDMLRIVAQNAADVVVLASHDAVAEWISDSVTELLGWTADELVGQRIDSFIHPDDLRTVVDFRADSPHSQTAAFFVRLRQKDGDYRWIAISSRRFTDNLTHASRIVSSWRDAQDLVATRLQLEASETRFRFLAENASDIVVETDANFNATWISPSVRDLLGWKPEAILNRPLADFILSEDLPIVRYEKASVEAGLKSNNLKIRCLTESGSFRWMVGRARQIRNDNGVVTSYVVSLRDIHDEESMRRDLESSEEHYRLLAENVADVIILVDADNVCRWVSPSSIDLLGMNPNEMIGRGSFDFVHPDDTEMLATSLAHPGDAVLSLDKIRFRESGGTYVWVSIRARNIVSSEGRLTARVVALRDISAQVLAEEAHAASEARLRVVLDNQSDVTAMLTLDGTIEWITPSVLGLIGWRADEVVGRGITEFVNGHDLPGLTVVIDNVIAGRRGEHETRLLTITGDERWVATRAVPLFDERGVTTGSIINVRDVDTEHRVRARLAESEERFRLAMVSAPIGMAVVGLDRQFLEVNLALCHMVGRDEKWMLHHGIGDILDPVYEPIDRAMRSEALAGRVTRSGREIRFLLPDGSLAWIDHAIGLLRDDTGRPQSFVSTFVDVTATRAAQEKLRYQATHDTLTQLVNRRDLYHRAQLLQTRVARSGDRVGVLYIDIDGFKTVNDNFGHFVGDATLKIVAQRLAAVGRDDDVVSRMGGDEFVILLPALHSIDDAWGIAQKIQATFGEPIDADGTTINVGVSIGVALAEVDETADDTLRRADAALYQAKSRGRGQSVKWDAAFA